MRTDRRTRRRLASRAARSCVQLVLVAATSGPLAAAEDFRPLLDFSDPSGTEEALRSLIPAAGEAETGYRAEILTQIARTYSRRGDFDEAHRILGDVEPLLSEDAPRATIRYLLERGRTFNLAETRKQEALGLFREAFTLADRAGAEDLAVDAAHMIALVEPAFEAQLEWTRRALSIAEAAADPFARKWTGSLCWNLGWTFFDHGDFAAALGTFQKNVAFQEKQGETKGVLQGRWAVGRTFRALGRFDEARALQEDLLAEYERRELAVYGYLYEELAELYHRAGDPRAPAYFRLAYEALESDVWMVNSQAERLERLRALGGSDRP